MLIIASVGEIQGGPGLLQILLPASQPSKLRISANAPARTMFLTATIRSGVTPLQLLHVELFGRQWTLTGMPPAHRAKITLIRSVPAPLPNSAPRLPSDLFNSLAHGRPAVCR